MDKDFIYKPVDEYKEYARLHQENVSQYFDELTKKANTDTVANESTVKKIRALEKENENIHKEQSRYQIWKVILWILVAIAIFALIAAFYLLLSDSAVKTLTLVLMFVISIIVIVGGLLLIYKVIKPKYNLLEAKSQKLEQEIANEYRNAYEQMGSLNALFSIEAVAKLFEKTIPLIDFDKLFSQKTLEFLKTSFGFDDETDNDQSTLYVQSGHLNGNPFAIFKNLYHVLGTKTYVGTKTISWTETIGSGKDRRVVTRTQTLTASLEKPCPYYSEQTHLVYGNEAAPDLSFHRKQGYNHRLSPKRIERKVRSDIEDLKDKTEDDIQKSITLLGNDKFEVLFRALNRDHEVQFRLLFTPLAQQNMIDLLLDKDQGFGDDFAFAKKNKLNFVSPDHIQGFKLNITPKYFVDYDYQNCKQKFIKYNMEYFRQVYFTFAPILCIPLYQHHSPHEYVYKDVVESYSSFFEDEMIVNNLGEEKFSHPDSKTRNILKTKLVNINNKLEDIEVTAYGYDVIQRVTYISKAGGDGRIHEVPVYWDEYIPVEQANHIQIDFFDDLDKIQEMMREQDFQGILDRNMCLVKFRSKED
ncbi:MAG TPA: hypothetical protein GXZ51_02895 [Acholeplasma sp.]|jgi:hypothetical protein|nr:hypothetical protein [Acholeplasma sp.]